MIEIQEQHSIQSYRIGINSYINAIISSYSTENAEKILRKFYIFISTWCDGAEMEPVECSRNTKIQDLIEMAELTQAVNKFWRKQLDCGRKEFIKGDEEICYSEEFDHLVEEMADVQLMLFQMEYLLNADITGQMRDKVERQMERLDERN